MGRSIRCRRRSGARRAPRPLNSISAMRCLIDAISARPRPGAPSASATFWMSVQISASASGFKVTMVGVASSQSADRRSQVVFADGADLALRLRHDDIGPQRLQPVAVHAIDGEPLLHDSLDPVVDIPRRAIQLDFRLGAAGQRIDIRRENHIHGCARSTRRESRARRRSPWHSPACSRRASLAPSLRRFRPTRLSPRANPRGAYAGASAPPPGSRPARRPGSGSGRY